MGEGGREVERSGGGKRRNQDLSSLDQDGERRMAGHRETTQRDPEEKGRKKKRLQLVN